MNTRYLIISLAVISALFAAPAFAGDGRLPIKVVVVAMYEIDEARGDYPGELQLWVERLKLDTELPFPLGESKLFLNDEGVLAFVTGGGIPNATASVMALGLDPRFDLSKTYWLVAGVAGADPSDLSLGSAAWARHVVDGDLAYEIDGREIPEDWPYGLFPLGSKEPASPIRLPVTWSSRTPTTWPSIENSTKAIRRRRSHRSLRSATR